MYSSGGHPKVALSNKILQLDYYATGQWPYLVNGKVPYFIFRVTCHSGGDIGNETYDFKTNKTEACDVVNTCSRSGSYNWLLKHIKFEILT